MTEKQSELTPLQSWLYDIIKEILEGKEGVVEPCVAHIREIRNSINVEIETALTEMCQKKILSFTKDVNKNPMFKIAK